MSRRLASDTKKVSARPDRSAAALLVALCLLASALLAPAPVDARVRHHHRHLGAKKAHRHLVARFERSRGRLGVRSRRARRRTTGSGAGARSVAAGPQPLFGAFTRDAPYGGNVDAVESLQSALRRRVDIVNWFQNWSAHPGTDWVSQVQPGVLGAVTGSGRAPLLTWEPWDPAAGADQPRFRLRRIVAGDFDAYIAGWADALRDSGHEVYLRPMHEFNGDWYPWGAGVGDNTPDLYVAAWRHLHDIFAAHGASNVRWVWCPVPHSVPDTPQNALERYYPGAAYVDVLSLDGYNWGSDKPEYGGWQSFSQIFKGAYDRLAALGPQPIWFAEVGSAARGGDKAAWVRDMWSTATHWPRLRALVWFDQDKEEDWRAIPVASAFFSD